MERAGAYSSFQAWRLVGVLHLTYLLSFVDRTALSLLVGPIKASLQVSDTQMGLLQGLAFGLLYALLGVPFGWAVDRMSRKGLVTVGVLFWSAATAWCGLARTYVELFIARTSVGIGEATLSPAAPSMIADAFAPEKRGLALSVYQAAGSLGVGLALIVGGVVAKAVASAPPIVIPGFGELEPWRVVFLVLAAPGLLVAALVFSIKEPPRRTMAQSDAPPESFISVLRARPQIIAPHFAGFALFTVFAYGALGWIPTYFVRVHGWDISQVGTYFGMAFLAGGPVGAVLGGLIADRWSAQGVKAAAGRVMTLGVGAMAIVGVLAPLSSDSRIALCLFGVVAFLFAFPSGASLAFLADQTPASARGRITAVYYLTINLAGAALGATAIGLLNDFVFSDQAGIAYSLAVLCALTCAPAALLLAWASHAAARSEVRSVV